MTPAAKTTGDASWTPVIWSIAVFPGLGQWMQRRRDTGTFYASVFLILSILFAWVLVVYLKQAVPVLRDTFTGVNTEGQTLPPVSAILKPFGAVLFVYFANVVDVLRGRTNLIRATTVTATT